MLLVLRLGLLLLNFGDELNITVVGRCACLLLWCGFDNAESAWWLLCYALCWYHF